MNGGMIDRWICSLDVYPSVDKLLTVGVNKGSIDRQVDGLFDS